jgi:hypothetical protein
MPYHNFFGDIACCFDDDNEVADNSTLKLLESTSSPAYST